MNTRYITKKTKTIEVSVFKDGYSTLDKRYLHSWFPNNRRILKALRITYNLQGKKLKLISSYFDEKAWKVIGTDLTLSIMDVGQYNSEPSLELRREFL